MGDTTPNVVILINIFHLKEIMYIGDVIKSVFKLSIDFLHLIGDDLIGRLIEFDESILSPRFSSWI